MADESGDKTEEPTPKKLDDARKKGEVWKSKDLTSAVVFFTGYTVMALSVDLTYSQFHGLFNQTVARIASPGVPAEDSTAALMSGLIMLGIICVPIVVAAALVGGLADFLQVGPLLTGDPVMPKLEKINPIAGMKNIFSKKTAIEAIKNLFKLTLAGYLAWSVLRDNMTQVVMTIRATPAVIATVVGHLIYKLTMKVGLLLVLTAIFDLWWQHHSYMKDQRMTKDEVKREYKESEGDPHNKSKRKELHQEILEHSAIENVKNADVVITNPTHVAVAVQYRKHEDRAPRILAHGIDARAAQIRELAKLAGVPMVRNVPLAHALNRLEVGDEIPEDLYDAVAEVLNFVFAMSERPPQE